LNRLWQLYAYFRPFAPIEPIYIGIGVRDRPYEHLRFARGMRPASQHSNPSLIRVIRTGAALGLETPVVVLRSGLTADEAIIAERAFIAAIGRAHLGTGPLLNRSPGGPVAETLSVVERTPLPDIAINAELRRRDPLKVSVLRRAASK
jgi:hypothetical protein